MRVERQELNYYTKKNAPKKSIIYPAIRARDLIYRFIIIKIGTSPLRRAHVPNERSADAPRRMYDFERPVAFASGVSEVGQKRLKKENRQAWAVLRETRL